MGVVIFLEVFTNCFSFSYFHAIHSAAGHVLLKISFFGRPSQSQHSFLQASNIFQNLIGII